MSTIIIASVAPNVKARLGFQNKLPQHIAIRVEYMAETSRQEHDIQIIEQLKQLVIKAWGLLHNSSFKIAYSDTHQITQMIHSMYDQSLLARTTITTVNGSDGEKYEYRMTLVGDSFIEPENDASFSERVKMQSRCTGLTRRGAIQHIGISHRNIDTGEVEITCSNTFDVQQYENISNSDIGTVLRAIAPYNVTHWLRSRICFLNVLKQDIVANKLRIM